MANSQELKTRLDSTRDQLTEAERQAAILEASGAERAAAGDFKESERCFDQADALAVQIKRLTATAAILERQLADARQAEKQSRLDAAVKEKMAVIDRDHKEQSKRLDALVKAWGDLFSYSADDDRLNGDRILGSLFESYNPFFTSENRRYGCELDPDKVSQWMTDKLSSVQSAAQREIESSPLIK